MLGYRLNQQFSLRALSTMRPKKSCSTEPLFYLFRLGILAGLHISSSLRPKSEYIIIVSIEEYTYICRYLVLRGLSYVGKYSPWQYEIHY